MYSCYSRIFASVILSSYHFVLQGWLLYPSALSSHQHPANDRKYAVWRDYQFPKGSHQAEEVGDASIWRAPTTSGMLAVTLNAALRYANNSLLLPSTQAPASTADHSFAQLLDDFLQCTSMNYGVVPGFIVRHAGDDVIPNSVVSEPRLL